MSARDLVAVGGDSATESLTTGAPRVEAKAPLDPWDEVFHGLHDTYEGAWVGAPVLHLRGRVEPEPLRAALETLQHRHPKLRARVVGSRNGPHAFEILAPPPPIPFEIVDFDTDALPWKPECLRLMRTKLDPTRGPLSRALVLRSRSVNRSVIMFLVPHVLGDGGSALRLATDLLEYYERAEGGSGSIEVESRPIVTRPGARPTLSLPKRLLTAARLARRARAHRQSAWTELPRAEDVPAERLWLHHVFSKEDTLALFRRCRKENTTTYGALFAATARGVVATLSQPLARFRCRIPIDVRSKLTALSGPVTGHDLGNFIGGYEKIYPVREDDRFWPLARQARRDVHSFVASGGPPLVYDLVRFVRVPKATMKPRRSTLLINSYGVVGFRDRNGSLSLEELTVGFKNDRVGPSLILQGIVVQRRLNLSLSAVDVPEPFWEKLHHSVLEELGEAVHGAPDGDGATDPTGADEVENRA